MSNIFTNALSLLIGDDTKSPIYTELSPEVFKDNSEKPLTPPTSNETAWTDRSIFHNLMGGFSAFNPDMLVRRRGFKVYRQMLLDPQVKAAYNLLIDIIVSREYNFEKQDDAPINDEVIDFFEHNINVTLRGSWIAALRTIELAKAQGYSVSEKNFIVEDWRGRDKWMIKTIKSKPYETFAFDVDEYGNVKSLRQEQDTTEKKLNPEKFIVMVNMPEMDPVFGESDLKAAYRPYWEKDNILKFRNIWLERLAGGFVVAVPGPDAASLQEPDKSEFQAALRNLSKSTSMMGPAGWEVKIVGGTDTEAFEKAVVHCDRQIAKSLLMPNLIGLSEEGRFGSRALGDTQFEAFMQIIKEQGDYLADVLNEQLFRQLALWNFDIKSIPLFKFENFTDIQRRKMAAAWAESVKNGVVVNTFEDETRTRQLLLYPAREEPEEEEPVEKPEDDQKPVIEPVEIAPTDNEPPRNEMTNAELKSVFEILEKNGYKIEKDRKSDLVLDEAAKILKEAEKTLEENAIEFADRINFESLEQKMNRREGIFFNSLASAVDKSFADIKEEFREVYKNLPSDKNAIQFDVIAEEISAAAIRPETKTEMNRAVQKQLREIYDMGRTIGQSSLEKAVSRTPAEIKDRILTASDTSRRSFCKALDWEVSNFVEGIALDTAESFFQSEAFKITGDLTEEMLKHARRIFVDGIRDELSVQEIIQQLTDVLPTLVGKINPATGKPDKQERARIETIVRTNLTNVFTQAQLSVYADPDLEGFVTALEYSAIIDSRTTDICENLDGRKYKINDPIWNGITPPNHFNCRSVLIPITELDQWTESSKEGFKRKSEDGQGNLPAPGFGGPSVRRTLVKDGEPAKPAAA